MRNLTSKISKLLKCELKSKAAADHQRHLAEDIDNNIEFRFQAVLSCCLLELFQTVYHRHLAAVTNIKVGNLRCVPSDRKWKPIGH